MNNQDKSFLNKNERLRKICMKECKKGQDKCYSDCVFLYDFVECVHYFHRAGTKRIQQCQSPFFGPSAEKYGELPQY